MSNWILTAQTKVNDEIKKAIQKSISTSCTLYVVYGRKQWIGSGFHLGNGMIATASHVAPPELMNEAYEIIANFNGQMYNAKIAISEPNFDSAILFCSDIINKIGSVNLADSNTVEIGDIIAVISSPEGMGYTATTGRVANINQGMGLFAPTNAWKKGLIIIDADILEGSSGGMVILTNGQVIGSVMGEFGQHVDVYGMGHRAICPSNHITTLLKQIA